jgi:hypothetical protein
MTRDEIKNLILRRAYAGAFEDGVEYRFKLDDFAASNGIDRDTIWKVFDEMEDDCLIDCKLADGIVEPTVSGLTYCEDHGLVDPEMVHKQRMIRTKLLVTLYDILERSPHGTLVYREYWLKESGISNQDFVNNESLMRHMDLFQDEEIGSYTITASGNQMARDYKARVQRVYEFDKLDKLEGTTEQQRGHKLEDFISEILESEGWEVDKRTRSQGQEMDIIIHKDLDYFFISCKWEKEPIQPKELELMYARALSRKDVKGSIVVSLSGFTDNCINEIVRKIESCHVLIFGPQDMNTVLSCEKTFTNLIHDKYKEVMLHRRILLDGRIRDVKSVPEKE